MSDATLIRDDQGENSLRSHLTAHFGTPRRVNLSDPDGNASPVELHIIRVDDMQIVVTEGMSVRPSLIGKGSPDGRFVELVMYLPDDWPIGQLLQYYKNVAWPIEWLCRIALSCDIRTTWVDAGTAVISNEGPLEPFASNTKLSHLLLLRSPYEFGRWVRPDGTIVSLFDVYPIYSEERDCLMNFGLSQLMSLFDEHLVSRVLSLKRKNTVLEWAESLYHEAVANEDLAKVNELMTTYSHLRTRLTFKWLFMEGARKGSIPLAEFAMQATAHFGLPFNDIGLDNPSLLMAFRFTKSDNFMRWFLDQFPRLFEIVGPVSLGIALASAASSHRFGMVDLLLERGVDINRICTNVGGNPLSITMTDDNQKAVAYLRSKGALTPDEIANSKRQSEV